MYVAETALVIETVLVDRYKNYVAVHRLYACTRTVTRGL